MADQECVVITGTSGDMGSALADSFIADGFRVFGGDVRPAARRDGLEAVVLDVTDRDAVFAFAKQAASAGRLAIWVNTAGVFSSAPIGEASAEEWDRIIAINLTGTFNGCAAALEYMQRNAPAGGRIVNIGSLSGQLGGLGPHPAYGASKAGVHALTKTYALAGARYGITCNAVAPSIVEGAMRQGFPDAHIDRYLKAIPIRRLIDMDEVVAGIRYLTSEKAAYTNGIVLPINGGQFMSG